MMPIRSSLILLALSGAMAAAPAGLALAQKADSIPGGVEHQPEIGGSRSIGTSRGLMDVKPASPAAASKAAPAEAAPPPPAPAPAAKASKGAPKATDKRSGGKKKKSSAKRSFHYESAPHATSPGGGRDDIPGGVEHKRTAPGQQP